MRRDAKIDANQPEIVETFRAMGCSVVSAAPMGKGFPDLIVGYRGRNYLIEVKDGSKPPSKRKLTPDQEDFHRDWRGRIHVIESKEKAENFIRMLDGCNIRGCLPSKRQSLILHPYSN